MLLLCTLLALLVFGAPAAAPAISLTGIMVYSSDDFGNPSGYDWDTERLDTGVLWRTAHHPHWYTLGVLSGLPPSSLDGPFLNAPDLTIDLPLAFGENYFTLVGETGGGGGGDLQRFVLDLFLDGAEDLPSISVLMPRKGASISSAPLASRADIMLTFSVAPVRVSADAGVAPQASYTDGTETASVSAAAFGWIGPFPVVDLLSGGSLVPNGTGDVVGFITIQIEETEPPAPIVGGGPADFGVRAGTGLPQPDAGGSNAGPQVVGAPLGGSAPQMPRARDLQVRGSQARALAEPTPFEDAFDAARETGTARVEGTPTVADSHATPSAMAGTPTPRRSPKGGTPTPKATSPSTTPSPNASASAAVPTKHITPKPTSRPGTTPRAGTPAASQQATAARVVTPSH